MMLIEKCKKNVDFLDVYYEVKNMIVLKKDVLIKNVEELKGKIVGV